MKFMLAFLFSSSIALAQAPLLTSVLPVAVTAYGPAFTLKVYGSQFTKTCVVNWGLSPRATTYVSPTELRAEILASDIATPTTAFVTVVNDLGPYNQVMTNGLAVPVTGGVPALSWTKLPGPWNDTPYMTGTPTLAVSFGENWGLIAGGIFWANNGDASFTGSKIFPGGSGVTFPPADMSSAGGLALFGYQHITCSPNYYLFDPSGTTSLSGEVVVGDFNRDGNNDFLDYGAGKLWLGDGSCWLKRYAEFVSPFRSDQFIQDLIVGDFNNDGKLDLAAVLWDTSDQTGSTSIALGNGDGTFQAPMVIAAESMNELQTADVNGDGIPDLIGTVGGSEGALVSIPVWLGKGDGTFTLKGSYSTGLYGGVLVLADMFGGHRQDAVFYGFPNHSTEFVVEVLPGNQDGSFGAPVRQSPPGGNGDGGLIVADFNNDGRLDMVVGGKLYVQKPLVWLSTLHFDFGDQAVGTSSPTQSLTVKDTGAVAVPIAGVKITGPGAAEFTETNDCGSLAARGGTCTVEVQFSPASKGSFAATLTVEHAVEGVNTVALSGTGI
jgi:hypothetical protein